MSIGDYDWLDLSELVSEGVSGTGWDNLLRDLLNEINLIVAGSPTRVIARQIKEKVGTLRFYHRLENASPTIAVEVREAIERAEDASQATCFMCGKPGVTGRLGGWIVPLCDAHADQRHQKTVSPLT